MCICSGKCMYMYNQELIIRERVILLTLGITERPLANSFQLQHRCVSSTFVINFKVHFVILKN